MEKIKYSNKFKITLIVLAVIGFIIGFLLKGLALDLLLGGSLL